MANSNKSNWSRYPNFPPFGLGWGWGRGRGRGWGSGWGYGRGRCFRFPWLPRWWWADPDFWGDGSYPAQPDLKEEKEILTDELKALKEEMKAIEERLKELETKKK